MTRTAFPAIRAAAVAAAVVVVAGCRSRESAGGPYGDQVARVVPLIEKSVGLPFMTPPRIEQRTKAQVRDFVLQELEDERTVRDMTGMEVAYKRFGLIPDTLRLREFLVGLLEEQIAGYYDPKTDVLYVVEGSPRDVIELTVTHELIHALQDQYVDLTQFQHVEGQNDRQSAVQAVFEGQAVYEQMAVAVGGGNVAVNLPGGWDRVRDIIRESQSSMPIFATAPLVIQETLIFPYLSGAEFIRNFKTRKPGESVFDDLPSSTEQILHPSVFFSSRRDEPSAVVLPALRGATKTYENSLGEFETRLFLYEHLQDQNDAVRGASGWDGDRYAVLGIAGSVGLAWVTVWDSAVEAGEFLELMDRAIERRFEVTGEGESASRTFSGKGRSIYLRTAESGGRALVVYLDLPAGVNGAVLNDAAIQVTEPPPTR